MGTNQADDTFGFGVVFSDETLTAFEAADPQTYVRISESFAKWSEIDVYFKRTVQCSGGHGFAALGRVHLLQILQERARALGVDLRFSSEAQRSPSCASTTTSSSPRMGRTAGVRSRALRSAEAAYRLPDQQIHVAGH